MEAISLYEEDLWSARRPGSQFSKTTRERDQMESHTFTKLRGIGEGVLRTHGEKIGVIGRGGEKGLQRR